MWRYCLMLAVVVLPYWCPPEASNWPDDLTLRTMASVAVITIALAVGRKSMCFVLVAALELISILCNIGLGIEYYFGGDACWYPWAQAAIFVSEVGCLAWGMTGVKRLQRDYDHCAIDASHSTERSGHHDKSDSAL